MGWSANFTKDMGMSLLTLMPYVFWRILDFEITGEDFDEVDQLVTRRKDYFKQQANLVTRCI